MLNRIATYYRRFCGRALLSVGLLVAAVFVARPCNAQVVAGYGSPKLRVQLFLIGDSYILLLDLKQKTFGANPREVKIQSLQSPSRLVVEVPWNSDLSPHVIEFESRMLSALRVSTQAGQLQVVVDSRLPATFDYSILPQLSRGVYEVQFRPRTGSADGEEWVNTPRSGRDDLVAFDDEHFEEEPEEPQLSSPLVPNLLQLDSNSDTQASDIRAGESQDSETKVLNTKAESLPRAPSLIDLSSDRNRSSSRLTASAENIDSPATGTPRGRVALTPTPPAPMSITVPSPGPRFGQPDLQQQEITPKSKAEVLAYSVDDENVVRTLVRRTPTLSRIYPEDSPRSGRTIAGRMLAKSKPEKLPSGTDESGDKPEQTAEESDAPRARPADDATAASAEPKDTRTEIAGAERDEMFDGDAAEEPPEPEPMAHQKPLSERDAWLPFAIAAIAVLFILIRYFPTEWVRGSLRRLQRGRMLRARKSGRRAAQKEQLAVFYRILALDEGATEDELDARYDELLQQHTIRVRIPGANANPETQSDAEASLHLIGEAYRVLKKSFHTP